MTLELFDTLENRTKPFQPVDPGHAKIYVCGPTTYDDAHIGHARPCIVYDVLVRHLRSRGMRVTYVRNVTDIDDKIIARARENGETPAGLAQRMLISYQDDMRRLGNRSPDFEPKVSEHLPEITGLIQSLIERGHAYAEDGDVYFSVASKPDYGKLSHRDLAQLEMGASERVDELEAKRKRHPADFALWKSAKPGEPVWDSPFGPGRPGWHIECSAMSMRYLGPTLDLHGGGLDLVFPHHENEIAQSEAATSECYCGHWVHNGFVQVNREKMSKSLGNFFRLREAFDRAEPEAIRYSLLSVHYRAPYALEVDLDESGRILSFPQFREAESRLIYLYSTLSRFADFPEARLSELGPEAPPEVTQFAARLGQALDDDLNTAQALAHVAALLKATNEILDTALAKKGTLSRVAHAQLRQGLSSMIEVLGLGADDARSFLGRVRDRRASELGVSPAWVRQKLEARARARSEKDFSAADAVRNELTERGVEILDSPAGTDWRLA